jgi:Kef-type K+ transport system membrane component KefB
MIQFLYILIFIGIFFAIKIIIPDFGIEEISTLVVGIMLLTSYLFSNIVKKIKLPRLSGYMLMGVILGASGIGVLTNEIVDNLQFLENLALSFIALTAGGELRFKQVKAYKKSIVSILISQMVIIFIGMAIIFYLVAGYMPFLSDLNRFMIVGLAILFAGTSLSTSPATAIGIITELQSEGKITNIVFIITVLKALLLILFFPIIITLSKQFYMETISFNLSLLIEITIQLIASVITGITMGGIIIWYFKKVKVEMSLFLLGITLAITEFSLLIGLEILLTSLVTGIVVQNYSSHGQRLISGIEIFSLPIYVIFFCFAGASLHLELLTEALFITFILVAGRFILNYAGNYVGAVFAREDRFVKNYSWMGYIGQAGIALGLGIIIEQNLPDEIGKYFLTVLISTVVINEMLGPILLKYIFVKSKEAKVQN